jgi:hypothetical protein
MLDDVNYSYSVYVDEIRSLSALIEIICYYLYNTFIPRYVLLRKIDVTNVTK